MALYRILINSPSSQVILKKNKYGIYLFNCKYTKWYICDILSLYDIIWSIFNKIRCIKYGARTIGRWTTGWRTTGRWTTGWWLFWGVGQLAGDLLKVVLELFFSILLTQNIQDWTHQSVSHALLLVYRVKQGYNNSSKHIEHYHWYKQMKHKIAIHQNITLSLALSVIGINTKTGTKSLHFFIVAILSSYQRAFTSLL